MHLQVHIKTSEEHLTACVNNKPLFSLLHSALLLIITRSIAFIQNV